MLNIHESMEQIINNISPLNRCSENSKSDIFKNFAGVLV